MKRFMILAAALAMGLAGAPAQATVVVSTFDNFNLNGTYGSWSSAILNSNPTSYQVISPGGFGGGFFDLNPLVNAAGESLVQLDATIEQGTVGFVVTLVDGDGTTENWGWFGLPAGNHVLTTAVNTPTFTSSPGATPGLDLSTLDFFHIQVDPGAHQGTYVVSYNNLQLIGIPEPGAATLAAGGVLGLMGLVRRRFAA